MHQPTPILKKPIVFLIGGSCGGKSATEKYLSVNHGMRPIISFATRPPRPNETDGVDYFFITPEELYNKSVANTIYISPEWLYAVPTHQMESLDTNGLIYSVINVDPAIEIINYIQSNNLPLSPIAVFMSPDIEQRKKCMHSRGDTLEQIATRIQREDLRAYFTTQMIENDIPHMVYTDELNENTQAEIYQFVTNNRLLHTKDEIINFLWSIIDNIDTASDIAKSDNELYRQIVEAEQQRRWELPATILPDETLVIRSKDDIISNQRENLGFPHIKNQITPPPPPPNYRLDTYIKIGEGGVRSLMKNKHTPDEARVIESILSVTNTGRHVEVSQDIMGVLK